MEMKKLRIWISGLLVIALTLGMAPFTPGGLTEAVAAGEPSGPLSGTWEGISWELTEDKDTEWELVQGSPYKLTIKGNGAMPDCTSDQGESAPWYGYHEYITSLEVTYGITAVGVRNFSNYPSLKRVQIADSVTDIFTSAFTGCGRLEDFQCGQGLKRIGQSVFYYCRSLKQMIFNEGLEEIGDYAFYSCGLEDVSFPESLTTLGAGSFDDCMLERIVLPRNVKSVGDAAFYNKLRSIEVAPENRHFRVRDHILYELKNGDPYRVAACACMALPEKAEINIEPGTRIIADYAFGGRSFIPDIVSVNLPDTVETICKGAFTGVRIQKLYIPDSVKVIEALAFASSPSLKEITLGKGLKSLDASAFAYSTSLDTIVISENNPYYDARDNVLFSKEHMYLILYAPAKPDKQYHVPDTVKHLGTYSFNGCKNLESLYLPEILNELGVRSVNDNQKLREIYFAGNAPAYGSPAINGNANDLIIYRQASASGWNDDTWKKFTLADWDPQNGYMDTGNTGGVQWTYRADRRRLTLAGQGGTLPDYTNGDAPWKAHMADIQTIETSGINGIGNYAFQGAQNLLQIKNNTDTERIGDYAFADCGSLKFFDFAPVKQIGMAAFLNAGSLTTLAMDQVSVIGPQAFKGCGAIREATFGGLLGGLPEEVFSGCVALRRVIVPESVTTIADRAFSGCQSLYSINIPASVGTIGTGAFSGCTTLEKVYFYGGVPDRWEADSFSGCNSSLTLYYRSSLAAEGWNGLGNVWERIPLAGLDRFFTEKQDQYSFANTADSFGYSKGYRIPLQRYVDVLDSITRGTYYYVTDGEWNGSGFGMVCTALEFYENPDQFTVTDYGKDAKNLYQLPAPGNKDAALTKLIEGYQVSQYKYSSGRLVGKGMSDLKELVYQVEQFERAGGLRADAKADPVMLVVYTGFCGHLVIPVSVVQDKDGDFRMRVYDPAYPEEFHTLTVRKDFSGIDYNGKTAGVYISYRRAADAMSRVTLHGSSVTEKDTSLRLAIDKEQGRVTGANDTALEVSDSLYEQITLGSVNEAFTGIRRFVVPEGSYKLSAGSSAKTKKAAGADSGGITFYMASGTYYAKVESTDENAMLLVSQAESYGNEMKMTLLQPVSANQETAGITLLNEKGKEKTIEIKGSYTDAAGIQVVVTDDQTVNIILPGKQEVAIDGEKVEVKDGQVTTDFESGTTPDQPSDPTKPTETDPTKPSVTDPTEPTVTDPTKPSVTDPTGTNPTKPTETDPTKPSVTTPTKPSVTGPTKPSVTDPEKPGPGNPTKPGTTEPEKPSAPGPVNPGTNPTMPGTTNPDQPSTPGSTGPSGPVNPSMPGTGVTVRFDAQGGTAVADVKVAKGGALSSIPVTVRSGYEFRGWYSGVNGTGYALTASTKLEADTTFYAYWTLAGRVLAGIRASYAGSAYVGDYIYGGLSVTAIYTDGSSEFISNYQLSQTILQEGVNRITVSYGGHTQLITITGVKKNRNVLRITAQYTGGEVPAGIFAAYGNLIVTAHYTDGTSERISGYTLSNNRIVKGNNTLTVIYEGRTADFSVTGYQGNMLEFGNIPGMPGILAPERSNIYSLIGSYIPVKEGYMFDGWYLDPECTNKVTSDTTTASGMTIYAKWTVIYDWTLNKTKVTLKKGKKVKLSVNGLESDKVTWKTSDKKIVKVSKTGEVKGKKAGTAYVTAVTFDGSVLRCRIRVKK